ncbi:hypothetical protein KAR91_77630 [Candidatus Pacearchaeota archaeon]|nr:hypothetical protein [Candidatus Pacearchaeota archaeon]
MADPEQQVFTKEDLEALAIADFIKEKLIDEYGDYPTSTIIMALIMTVNNLTKEEINQ